MPINSDAVDIAAHIGARLLALRKARGLSQKAIAPILGIRVAQVSKIETAESLITIDKLFKAAQFYDVPVAELLPLSTRTNTKRRGVADAPEPFLRDEPEKTDNRILDEANALATDYIAIRSPELRASLAAHVKALLAANT